MRHKITVFSLLVAALAGHSVLPGSEARAESEASNRMGSHGMVVIGNGDLALYHLALYRRPHDRQIMIPASIVDAALRADIEQWRAARQGIVTIVPENFDLDRLDPAAENPITRFAADVYAGHFERGGTLAFQGVKFEIGPALLHKPVQEDAPTGERYTYVEYGKSAWLVRDIGPRPGTDRILAVAPQPDAVSGMYFTAMPTSEQSEISVDRESFDRATEAAAMTEVYFEIDDFR